jgi:hypothetical protein
MALIEQQFDNKLAFYPIGNLTFEQTTNGLTWTTVTVSDQEKRRFVGGDTSSGVVIPNGVVGYRISIRNSGAYVYLNALYSYWSGNGNTTAVRIYKKHDSNNVWTTHTNSSTQIGSWPGHMYMPFNTIPYLLGGTFNTHWNDVRIEYSPTWNNSNNINLFNLQLWGGYPAGKRRVYSIDEFKNFSFPANISASNLNVGAKIGTWITSDAMSDAIGWNTDYGTYIGSNIGGTHYLRGNGTFTTGGSTYNLWHSGNFNPSLKANLASPALTGTPTAPTAAAGTNTTQIATTAFVGTAVSNLVDSSPATLDTLNELAAALGDDPNFATTVSTSIGTKVSKSGDTMTGVFTLSQNPVGTTYGNGVNATPTTMLAQTVGDNDGWRLYGEAPVTNDVKMIFEVVDDNETGDTWVFRNKRTYSPFTATEDFKITGEGHAIARGNLTANGGLLDLAGYPLQVSSGNLLYDGDTVIHEGNIGSYAPLESEVTWTTAANATWNGQLQLGGNGSGSGNTLISKVQSTNGNLHLDPGTSKDTYLNYYNNGNIYLNGVIYYINSSGSFYNGTSAGSNALEGYSWTSAGKNVRGTEIYADNWFRNYNVNEGLYNEATQAHWYSKGAGNWTAYTTATTTEIRLETNNQTRRGSLYADSSNNIGLLDENGNWALRVDNSVNTILSGGLVIDGSVSSGGYEPSSQYEAAGTNIILKGDSLGRSGIFFESEKNGTNINHTSDFGYIQFFPYGVGGSSGESNELVIGVSNDSDDHIILNAPASNGLRYRVGAGTTDYQIWHQANLSFSLSVTTLTITY